ncbi:MAG TPA: transporter [Terracidiphilus sp.]|nr:transporter [Terracidiphilus sp.]
MFFAATAVTVLCGPASAWAQPDGDGPVANPGRPTVSTPATLTPVGYLQFETGVLGAWHSPEFSSQVGLGEVVKYAIASRVQLLAGSGPYVHTDTQPENGTGDVTLGVQGVVRRGEGARPTVAVSYFGRVLSGDAPDLDVGSASKSAILLVSADGKGFHVDTNYLFNEVESDAGVRRTQYGQTLSISHGVGKRFGVSGELWSFTQPFLRGWAVGNLWAVNYNARRNLVFDLGFNRGLTSTSTRWELLTGFTYVLPRKIHLN